MSDFCSLYQSHYRSTLTDADLYAQLENVLARTSFDSLGSKYEGKVRDSYLSDSVRYLLTTDRLSCFDVVLTTIPFKGQVLNQLAIDWFASVEDIMPNHLIDVPHPNVLVVKNVDILPIEVVVRGYLTGSAWRDYQSGKAISGIALPAGLARSQKFETPLLTPSTKAERGKHDEPIAEAEIIARNIVDKKIWAEVREKALALFARGQELAAERGLLLVDTKYEFGILNGTVVLADEIHTLDSSRYWIADTYAARFSAGELPSMLDKEPTRHWLLENGYTGEGTPPAFTAEHRIRIARHYISSYEQITDKVFVGSVQNVHAGIESSLL